MHSYKGIKHIVHLPKWYPSDIDPQNGVFIEKHIRCISELSFSSVIYVIGREKQSKLFQLEESHEDHIYTVVCYFKKMPIIKPILYLIAFYSVWRKITHKHGYPHLIHAHVGLRPVMLAYVIGALHRIPYFISEHWSGFVLGGYEKKNSLYKRIMRYVYSKAKGVAVVSDKLESALEKHRLMNPDTTVIIPNVISKFLSKKETTKEAIIKIILVADLRDKIKNVSAVLRVLSEIKDKPFQFTIIGGGQDEEELKALAHSLDFGANEVIFTGVKNNAEVFYALYGSDFLISNSRFETFGMIPIEALACGTPVVCTFQGCPSEIHSPEYGFFYEKDDDEGLKRSIIKMMEYYDEFDAQLLVKPASYFYPERITEEFKKLYDLIEE